MLMIEKEKCKKLLHDFRNKKYFSMTHTYVWCTMWCESGGTTWHTSHNVVCVKWYTHTHTHTHGVCVYTRCDPVCGTHTHTWCVCVYTHKVWPCVCVYHLTHTTLCTIHGGGKVWPKIVHKVWPKKVQPAKAGCTGIYFQQPEKKKETQQFLQSKKLEDFLAMIGPFSKIE